MIQIQEKWLQKAIRADFDALANRFGLDPVTIRLMVNRGFRTGDEIERYLYGTLSDLHSPWLLKDMEKAVSLILGETEGKIAISSDFDCDGIFSAYILKKGLGRIGIKCEIFTPERVAEGYGLNRRIIDEAKEKGCTMVLTCDNGIAALEEVSYALEVGMKIVVTDHHDVQDGLPPADAIVNHKQEDCKYPFEGLCGAGVTYKLVQALYEKCNIPQEELWSLLEFVAIATVADVMDLVGENRVLVREGLKRLEKTENVGIRALMEAQGLNGKKMRAYHVGFVLGPCFNASGRLETVQMSFDLLEETDKKKAADMASRLKGLNDKRKCLTEEGIHVANRILEESNFEEKSVFVLLLPDCHESLVGIIAGRLKERYHRPFIVFTKTEDWLVKGSGRSIPAYNMFEKCMGCKELFIRFGGHPMAAGITMKEENLEELELRLNSSSSLSEEDLVKKLEIDVPMPVHYITKRLIRELELLEPFGKGNAKPVFAQAHFNISHISKRGAAGNVLAFTLISREGFKIRAVLFGETEQFEQFIIQEFGESTLKRIYRGETNETDVNFSYYPVVNEYNGYQNIEIHIGSYCRG